MKTCLLLALLALATASSAVLAAAANANPTRSRALRGFEDVSSMLSFCCDCFLAPEICPDLPG
jgi:hypothetical protein